MSDSIDFVLSIIKNHWSPGVKILEIGCGPAHLRKYFGKDYIGADITDKAYKADLPRDVDIVCPADQLKVDDSFVDIVVIKSAFFLFPDHKKSLEEAIRVLKPGGKLIIFDYTMRTQKRLQQKEGHRNYPCWTQWKLRRLLQKTGGFEKVHNLTTLSDQPKGLIRFYHLIRQEFFGTWAIVYGEKN